MPTGGQIGLGVKIGYATASPQSWTLVPEVREIPSLPNRERDRIESTVHTLSSDRTFIPGMSEVTDLEFVVRGNLDAGSVHSLLRGYERTQTELWWRVEIPVDPDVATSTYVAYTFLGKIATWELNAPMDELKTIRIVVMQTGSLFFQDEMASALPALS